MRTSASKGGRILDSRALAAKPPRMSHIATILLLGSGELGREFVISAKRLGARVIACDSYDDAPAMQLADAREVFSMLDGEALRAAVIRHQPDLIVPEIEAIRTEVLGELEDQGFTVVPSARAAQLTMNRDAIRDLAAGELGLTTSAYGYATSFAEVRAVATRIGFPLVMKPVMSSSGKGQSKVDGPEALEAAWDKALANSWHAHRRRRCCSFPAGSAREPGDRHKRCARRGQADVRARCDRSAW